MLYFIDQVLLESLLATFFMSIIMSLIGTLCVLKKKSLSGEVLSHSALPGVMFAYIFFGSLTKNNELIFSIILMGIAFLFCFFSQRFLNSLIKNGLSEDASLCFMLSFGLGLGILLQSILQKFHPLWFKKSQLFFYGQAATLVWDHVFLYAFLALIVVVFLIIFHQLIKGYLFDEQFLKVHNINTKWLNFIIEAVIAIAIVVGIRSCGVILVSGMLIIPVVTARVWGSSLKSVYMFSILFGASSSLLANFLSFWIPTWYETLYFKQITVALGPLIILISFVFCFLSLILVPKKGLVARFVQQVKNKFKVEKENGLKKFWKHREQVNFSIFDLQKILAVTKNKFWLMLIYFLLKKIFIKKGNYFQITKKGWNKIAYIVRIHRLFEVYLSRELHVDLKNVHGIAEELEHVISEDMENQFSKLLNNPLLDPHKQPIPVKKGDI